jgi:polar amino acid transport system substrate-binding protein
MLEISKLPAVLIAAVVVAIGFEPGGTFAAVSAGHHPASLKGAKLKNPGYLTVGSDTTYPPMESVDPHTQKAVGADVDLANALAKAMGLKGAKIVTQTFDSIILALGRGNFDVIMSSMNDTPAREKQISFIDYMRSAVDILVRKSASVHGNGYAAACGHSIAVETGTTELDGLTAEKPHCKNGMTIKPFTADTAAFQAFSSGHADMYSGDYVVCALYVKNHASAIKLAEKPFEATEDYGIGLPKKATALHSALTTALAKIRANGQYTAILKKWGISSARL